VLKPLKRHAALLFLASLSAFGPVSTAVAQEVKTVLELFTSQGCSSCPPADKLAADFAKDDSRLVISLPVNYWDYLGWKDTLAHSAFNKRQKTYALMRGDRQVYTPQVVINGMVHAVGSDKDTIEAGAVAAGALPLVASIEKEGGNFVVVLPAASVAVNATVVVMPVVHRSEVEIGRGENRGKFITYVNVVRGIYNIGQWKGDALRLPVPASALGGEAGDAESFVVLVQNIGDRGKGSILAAAKAPGF
jgi:hypothetical protein